MAIGALVIKRFCRFLSCWAPMLLLVLIAALAVFIAYDYFHQPVERMFRDHWENCGETRKFIDALQDEAPVDSLSLNITDRESGRFMATGRLSLRSATYARLVDSDSVLSLQLEGVSSPTAMLSLGQTLELSKEAKPLENGFVVIEIKETRLYGSGFPTSFPVDEYRLGFVPRLYVSNPAEKEWRRLPLDSAVTMVRLSDSMVVKKAERWEDYVQDVSLDPHERSRQYGPEECALIIKRAPWYQAVVLLLIVVLFIPAFYLLYRPDDNPGVDLIAVILGVAAIRQFLLGNVVDWKLYPLDLVFAGVTIVTASIPLWHIFQRKRAECRRRL